MKLFRKIYLRAALCMLALTAVMMTYLLLEMQRQTLSDAREYEGKMLENKINALETKIGKYRLEAETQEVCDSIVTTQFRYEMGDRGVLYRDGTELANSTPYEFDVQKVLHEVNEARGLQQSSLSATAVQRAGTDRLILYGITLPRSGFGSYSIVYYKKVSDIYARTQRLFLYGLCFLGLGLLVTGGLLYRGIYRAVRPVSALKQAAADIAGGAYQSRVSVWTNDEIGELTESFNKMAQQVEGHLEALEDTNERQRQLLGSLAHELKTPLTAIIGYADTLLTVRIGERSRERALRYIQSESRRLARLSEKMLELTGLYESGGQALVRTPVSVQALFVRLEALTQFRLQEKQLRLTTQCTPKSLVMELDEDLMMSLLMNLVDNSCKASQPCGEIRVTAEAGRIAVEDFGKGIPETEIARVTEAFYMVNKSRARSAGSVGLGLALCSRIADLHGARLQIESREGCGTRVSVLFGK